MKGHLTATKRVQLRQWQRRDNDGYVKVTAVLMLDAGWPVAAVGETLGLNEATVCRSARAFTASRLTRNFHVLDAQPAS